MNHKIEDGELDGYGIDHVLAFSYHDGKRLKLRIYPSTRDLIFTVYYTTTNLIDESIPATKNFDTLEKAIEFYNTL